MVKWKNASQDDLKRLRSIKILFGHKTDLIDFIFHPLKPRLSYTPENLKEKMKCFGTGEQTLILIAMDIWGSYGGIHFDDLYTNLSLESLHNCMKALAHITNRQS